MGRSLLLRLATGGRCRLLTLLIVNRLKKIGRAASMEMEAESIPYKARVLRMHTLSMRQRVVSEDDDESDCETGTRLC